MTCHIHNLHRLLGRFYCTLSPFEGFRKHCHKSQSLSQGLNWSRRPNSKGKSPENEVVINLYLISTLKGTTKATNDDVLKLNTLKGTKTTFLTPKRYDEHHVIFILR